MIRKKKIGDDEIFYYNVELKKTLNIISYIADVEFPSLVITEL